MNKIISNFKKFKCIMPIVKRKMSNNSDKINDKLVKITNNYLDNDIEKFKYGLTIFSIGSLVEITTFVNSNYQYSTGLGWSVVAIIILFY
jgi:hypothetical protein